MSAYTIVDATGEIVSSINVPDEATRDLNTPTGCVALEGNPPNWQSYYSNGSWVDRPAQSKQTDTWDKTTKTWVDARTLDEAKVTAWDAVKVARDVAISVPLVTPYGTFDADTVSRSNISDSVLLANNLVALGQTPTITYTLHDNTVITLSAAEMVTVGLLLGQQVQGAFATARTLRDTINSATTNSAADAVVWS